MSDVARLAGVSVSTVSYALTGARPISRPTRERVERAMLQLGYTPNALARGLKSKRSKIIALVYPAASSLSPSALEYLLSASDHAQDRGYHPLLWTTDADALDDLARLSGQGLVEGALIMEVRLKDPRIQVVRDAGLAFTMIGRPEDPTGLDYADTDFEQCADVAVGYLVGQGHRRLGFVNLGPPAVESGRGNAVRLQAGVRRAARAAGARLSTVLCQGSVEAGREAFRELAGRDPGVTAVISFNHRAAPGVMAAALDTGRRIPADFSIISVDMPPRVAELTIPEMTTVGPSAAEMARAAVEMLIRRLEGDTGPPSQTLFQGQVHPRASCGPAHVRSSPDIRDS
jgi:DNA-binding LacI/PurR family transcriptional regulator